LLQLRLRDELREDCLRRQLAVAESRKELVRLPHPVLAQHTRHRFWLGEGLEIEPVAPRFLVEKLPAELEASLLLFRGDEVPDLVSLPGRDAEVQPVAAWLVTRRRDDLHEVPVAKTGPKRHHLAVDPRAD